MRSPLTALLYLLILLALCFFPAAATSGQTQPQSALLVIAAHPDDEALMASGIIRSAVQSGRQVKVVIVTNGDVQGVAVGLQREQETMAAMTGVLGLKAADVIFLGYPDSQLLIILNNYVKATDALAASNGRSSTYGNQGFGGKDYHSALTGSPASYNKVNVVFDINSLLSTFRPGDIYLTGEFDEHQDHRGVYYFVREAVQQVMGADSTYRPVLHKTIIHSPLSYPYSDFWPSTESRGVTWPTFAADADWPNPPAGSPFPDRFDPSSSFAPPVSIENTPLRFSDRESVPVPAEMRSTDPLINLKYQAIAKYATQRSPFLFAFCKSDEIFWKEIPNPPSAEENVAQAAVASASSETPSNGQTASKAIDGIIDGYPGDYTREWASNGELAGAWIKLTWQSPHSISRVSLYDRPNSQDQITSGVLTFSNGDSMAVGALDNAGARTDVTFAAKTVTWVKLTISGAKGFNAGLAEMEAYGGGSASPANRPPAIFSGPTAVPSSILDSQTSTITISANDPDGDQLSYAWSASKGSVSGSGATVVFNPLPATTRTSAVISVTVTDGKGGQAVSTSTLTVDPTPPSNPLVTNIARIAAASASSESISTSQTAAKAIDGIIAGYPTDYTREWVTQGQLAGAWIQLTWPSAQTVSKVILYDRPNLTDRIVAGTLTFSDGTSVPVISLNNDGSATTFEFPARTTAWVRFAVTGAVGFNAGLAEFEVYGMPAVAGNHSPAITSGPAATSGTLTDSQTTQIAVTATDSDNDPLVFTWRSPLGSISGTGSTVTFTPPTVTSQQLVQVSVTVSDGKGGNAQGSVSITVNPSSAPPPQSTNLARSAAVTASTQNTRDGQAASKAIDGVIDGYPKDYTKEWATAGELAGAWIQLTWSSAVTIDRAVLYDRPNLTDQVQAGILRFSDGSTVSVPALNDNGSATEVKFAARSVTSIRLEITKARGFNAGLSEFEVYGVAAPMIRKLLDRAAAPFPAPERRSPWPPRRASSEVLGPIRAIPPDGQLHLF